MNIKPRRSVFLLAAKQLYAETNSNRRFACRRFACTALKAAIQKHYNCSYYAAEWHSEYIMFHDLFHQKGEYVWWGSSSNPINTDRRIMALLLCAEMLRR